MTTENKIRLRLDSEGRNVTDLPGLWDEADWFATVPADSFVVFDTWKDRYVMSVSSYDGDIEHARNIKEAWIYWGDGWREFWGGDDRSREQFRIENIG